MKKRLSLVRPHWLLLGGALVLSAVACDEGTDGNEGTGGSPSGDGDGETDIAPDGGDGDDANNGGTSGDGDGDSNLGGSSGGRPGDGDGDGDGDAPGTGGSEPSSNPGVATLGQPCSGPGALACAGENQKLQLLCDGSKWVQNGTCNGSAVCDTGEKNRGSCQEPLEGCADKEPGETYCEDKVTRRCGTDRVKSELVEACGSYCNEEGTGCSADGECPLISATTFECASACDADETHCEQGEGECSFLDLSGVSRADLQGAYVRLPSGNDLCLEHLDGFDCDRRAFIVLLRNGSFQVHLPTGWRARVVPELYDDSAQYAGLVTCGEEFIEGCLEIETDPQASGFPAVVLTAEKDVPAGNLYLATDTPCSVSPDPG